MWALGHQVLGLGLGSQVLVNITAYYGPAIQMTSQDCIAGLWYRALKVALLDYLS